MNQQILPLPNKDPKRGPDMLINKMQRSVSASLVVSVLCLTFLAVIGIFNLLIGEVFTGILMLAFVGFMLWLHGGVYLYGPALLAFARQYQRQNLFECKKIILPYINLARLLPVRKDINVAALHNAIGVLHLHNGDYELAIMALQEAARIAEHRTLFDRKEVNSTIYATMLSNLSLAKVRLSSLDEAEELGVSSVRIWQEQKPALRSGELFPRLVLGEIAIERGDLNVADQELERARMIAETAVPPPVVHPSSWHWAQTGLYICLTYVKLRKNDEEAAVKYFTKLTEHVVAYQPCATTLAIHVAIKLAEEYMKRDMYDRAETILDIAYMVGSTSPYHPDNDRLLEVYKELLEKTNRLHEIEDLKRWVRPVLLKLVI